MVVNPYEVKGTVDYQRLVQQFGLSVIDESLKKKFLKITPTLHVGLRRGLFFAHRDLGQIFSEHEKGNSFALYTGRAPSGPVHLGHCYVWWFTKWLQDVFDVPLYFQFPDEEKFLVKKDVTLKDSAAWLVENMKDVAAIGFNPKKTFFIIDSKHANLLYPTAVSIAKHITFNMVRSTFGFTQETNVGALFYTSMQAAASAVPSIVEKRSVPVLIPHAVDQDPHFRLTRDVLPKIGYPKPASIQGVFLPSLQGMHLDGKMSSSQEENAILMTDTAAQIKKKINKFAFSGGRDTVEEHRKFGGNPDVVISYQWLQFFMEDDNRLKQIYDDYKSGKLLSGELKAILIEVLTKLLSEHQARRASVRIEDYMYHA